MYSEEVRLRVDKILANERQESKLIIKALERDLKLLSNSHSELLLENESLKLRLLEVQ